MAFNLSFEDAKKEIKLGELLGLPNQINYNKFIGLTGEQLAKKGLNPFNVPQTAVLGPVGAVADVFSKVTGYDIGLKPQVSLNKIGLQLDANFDLGGIKLDVPWAKAGALGLRLDGNNLVLNSGLNFNSELITTEVNVPSLKLFAGFPIDLKGKLDFNLGSKTYNLVQNLPFKYTYELFDFDSKEKSQGSSGTQSSSGESFNKQGFEIELKYPTLDKLKDLLKPKVSSNSIELNSSIPLFTIGANLVQIASNGFPLLKILSSSQDFGPLDISWKLLEASIKGGINLDLGAKINFGTPTAWLKFEDDSVSSPINLTSPNFTIPNILGKLDANNDKKATIQVQLGFANPSLEGKAGLSSNIFLEPTIGYAKVNVDNFASKEIGPIYQDKFPLLDFPLPFPGGSFKKELPASLAPTVTFKVDLDLDKLDDAEVASLTAIQIDGSRPVLRQNPLTNNPEFEENRQFIDEWGREDSDKIFLARKIINDNDPANDVYVLYKSSELNAPDPSDTVNPYSRKDLIKYAFELRDRNGNVITQSNPYLGKYRPIGAEKDASGNYIVIFRVNDYVPYGKYTPDNPPFYYWLAKEEIINNERFITQNTGFGLSTNQAAYYERILNEDINGTGFLEPGELISGNIAGTGLWKDEKGYWIGNSKATPTTYLSDPLGSSLPGEPIAFVYPQENFINPKYRGVLFQNGFDFYAWNVNEANEKIADKPNLDNEPLNDLQLGHFENILDRDLNGDNLIGINLIIDSDIDKEDYTTLSEFRKPLFGGTENKEILSYDAYYVVTDNDIKVPGFAINANIFLANPFKEKLGSTFLPSDQYIGRFNSMSDFIDFGWSPIAATFNSTLSTSNLKILDVMWKNNYVSNAPNPRWFLWRFEVKLPSSNTVLDPNNFELLAVAADKTENNFALYLNNSDEVSVYEAQFSEDFNGDGFLGKTTPIEKSSTTVVVLVEGNNGWRYEIKEENDTRGIKLPVFNGAYNIPTSNLDSTWKPIAVERIPNNFALTELTQAGKKYNEGFNYYYGLGKNSDTTYSLWLFSRNPLGFEATKELERSITESNLSAYEEIFNQDFNGDGVINKITRTIELFGQTNLLISSNGYIIDNQGNRLYLRDSDGTIITPQNFDGFPVGVEQTTTGFQLVRLRNGTSFELLEIDSTGRLQNSRYLQSSEFAQYASLLQQPLELNPTITITEDTATTIRLLSNDSTVNRDALILKSISQASNGSLTDNKDGTATYQPNANFNGTDSFTYTISNGLETSTSTATVSLVVTPVNDAPTLENAIADQSVTKNTVFSFQIPENTFSDVDAGDTLNYSATQENGNPLPSWLTFDAATRKFSGTPTNNEVGSVNLKVIATDKSDATANDTFTLTVANTNNAPTVNSAIADQSIPADTAFSFTFDADTFIDDDAGDNLTYSATLKDGSNLPSWLKFNPVTRTFSGTPTNANVSSLEIEVRAKDNDGLIATDTFLLTVAQQNGSPTFKLAKIADDIFTLANTGSKSKLKVTLTEQTSKLVNEIGVFTVDDAQGKIDGIASDEAGYAQAALNRAKVIFSAIANLPNGFNTNDLTHLLEFNSGENLRFYLVRNSTTDAVRAGVTPLTDLLFSNPLRQKITDLGNDEFSLAWKDTDGNSTAEFKDLAVKIQSTDDSLPLGTNLQGNPQGEVIDLRGITSQVKADFVVNREAAFDNFIGFYQVVDENGGIDTSGDGKADIFAGQVGYIEAAVRGRVAGIDLTVNNQGTATYTGTFQPGSIFAPFIIANGRPEALLDSNPNNDPAVYFPFLGANADKVDHIRLLGNNVFGFEDLPTGSDLDFNDAIVRVNLSIA